MGRKCSHCGNNGHNSRTCTNNYTGNMVNGGLRLFGVQLDTPSPPSSSSSVAMKKSFSMDCVFSSPLASSSPSSSSSRVSLEEISEKNSVGYLSDNNFMSTQAHDRKKGMSWTEAEHRAFLTGLETLGKGDWRGISRTFVTSRTPTQVASHAQKYFLRQTGLAKKKQRRSSLFGMIECSKSSGDRLNDSRTILLQEDLTTSFAEQSMISSDNRETNYDQAVLSRARDQMPIWLYGLIDSKTENQKITPDAAAVLDLNLKLSVTTDVPKPLDENNKNILRSHAHWIHC